MDSAIFVALPLLAFSGALMFLLPYMSPVRYFFSITVPPEFPFSETGRTVLRRYHRHILLVVALAGALVFPTAVSFRELAFVLAMLLPFIGGMFCFLRARNDVSHHTAGLPRVREAQLSTAPDRLPRWISLALLPFLAPLAAAIYLSADWERVPQRFAAHYNLAGTPDRWAEKSVGAVYGPLAIEAGLLLLILLLSTGMFHGARRGPQREAVLKIQIAAMYFIAFMLTAVALLPVIPLPATMLFIPTVLFSGGVVFWCVKVARNPDMPVDPTPDEYWHLGSFYYNPGDPAIFVQKRIGFGYTVNFANHLVWAGMGFLLLAIAGMLFAGRYR